VARPDLAQVERALRRHGRPGGLLHGKSKLLQRRAEFFTGANALVGWYDRIFANSFRLFLRGNNFTVKVGSCFQALLECVRDGGAAGEKQGNQNKNEAAIHFPPRATRGALLQTSAHSCLVSSADGVKGRFSSVSASARDNQVAERRRR